MTGAEEFKPESERVTRALRDQIIDGTRAPGSGLPRSAARRIAQRRAGTPRAGRHQVRDALRDLVADGFGDGAAPATPGRSVR
ncbi:GntR family transcriptional regulator [Streptomyces tanashiensis]